MSGTVVAGVVLSLGFWFGAWWALKLNQLHFGRVVLGITLWVLSDLAFEPVRKVLGY